MIGKLSRPVLRGGRHGDVSSLTRQNEVMKAVSKGITAQKGLSLIRYADDFVILHKDLAVVQRCQQIAIEFLGGMGLELKPSKTRMAHTLIEYEGEQPGFDFLGFTIRQFPAGKYQSGKSSNGKPLGFKTLIKPSQKKVKLHAEALNDTVKTHKAAYQGTLINLMNPIITGWSNYYSAAVSKKTFSELDNTIYHQLRAWSRHRHPNKNAHWIADRYWLVNQGEGWVFACRGKGKQFMRLKKHSETQIIRHIKVQGERSLYDGDKMYWSTRMGRHPEFPKSVTTLLKKQKGRCAHCETIFKDGDLLEKDHIIPRSQGGRNIFSNLQLLHRHCHDKKTASDLAKTKKEGKVKAKPVVRQQRVRGKTNENLI